MTEAHMTQLFVEAPMVLRTDLAKTKVFYKNENQKHKNFTTHQNEIQHYQFSFFIFLSTKYFGVRNVY